MGYSLKSFIGSVVVGIGLVFSSSLAANAQVVFGSLEARIDPFSPMVLGENLELSACGSFFDSDSGGQFDLCDAPTINEINFAWTLREIGNPINSLNLTGAFISLATGGISDFISVIGNYSVTLNVSTIGFSANLNLDGGALGIIDGFPVDSAARSVTFTAASVPEPESLLLLVPALLMIGRRQRRLMKSRRVA